jgi:aspartokinase/homoserine dehydrogenase 1
MKFGGSSVASPERILHVLDIIKQKYKKNKLVCVIFSAFQGITDQLIKMGNMAASGDQNYRSLLDEMSKRHISTAKAVISKQNIRPVIEELTFRLKNLEEILYGVYLVKELTPKTRDYVMSFGERLSAFIISESLNDRKVKNDFLDTRDLIITDDVFGNAHVDFKRTNYKIRKRIGEKKKLYIITGFIGSTAGRETTTLGRGGSDFSASVFGAALGVKEIEIWTDVDGVLTADPRKVPQAFAIEQMTYEEAMELSHFGAKVIHPPTMQPALDKGIPLRIKNTFNPDFPGTVISKKSAKNGSPIRGLSSIDKVSLLQIQGSGMVGATGIAERIFRALADANVNIILISQASSEHSICLGILPDAAKKAKSALENELKYELHYGQINEITIESGMSVVAIVGENMRQTKGIAGRIFKTLGDHGVNISAIAQGSSELNISVVVARRDEAKGLNVIHDQFYKSEKKSINLYLVGTGLIGSELLRQITMQRPFLSEKRSLGLNLIGIADIDKMLFKGKGLEPGTWLRQLSRSNKKMKMEKYIEQMIEFQLPNSVFVDCTASTEIAQSYEKILKSGVSVVTPNKMANTQSMPEYKKLRKIALEKGVYFKYETNVGAGLPVIESIQNMMASGDKLIKVEAVLSGTLSYLFNGFDGSKAFSRMVKEAKEKGYTEPDPRQDLNGMDVARKLLILIREAGVMFEMKQLKLKGLLPAEAAKAKNVNQLYTILKKYDQKIENERQLAAEKGKVLRYLARYEAGRAEVGLTGVDASHPAYSLVGSENIIIIHSDFYNDYPLVIKGPGAGAAVTAAGVFADILRISN